MNDTIQPKIVRPHGFDGEQRLYRFDNGHGASVVRFTGSYGAAEGLWELAVLHFAGPSTDDFKLVYDTPVADDVVGWLDEAGIQEHLRQIRDLPARETAAEDVTR